MNTTDCGACGGEGYQYGEGARGEEVEDRCYHCLGTGKLDSETARQDRLYAVAGSLAHVEVVARRREDEEFGLCAAEHQMTEFEYFRDMVWALADRIGCRLGEMTREEQEFMLAIDDDDGSRFAVERSRQKAPKAAPVLPGFRPSWASEDDLPF